MFTRKPELRGNACEFQGERRNEWLFSTRLFNRPKNSPCSSPTSVEHLHPIAGALFSPFRTGQARQHPFGGEARSSCCVFLYRCADDGCCATKAAAAVNVRSWHGACKRRSAAAAAGGWVVAGTARGSGTSGTHSGCGGGGGISVAPDRRMVKAAIIASVGFRTRNAIDGPPVRIARSLTRPLSVSLHRPVARVTR